MSFGPAELLIIAGICASVVATLAFTIGSTVLAIYLIRKAVGPNRNVLAKGTPARAVILSVQQTGGMVNYQPQVMLQLEVHPSYGLPYRVVTKAVIPMINIPQFQPGAEVPVKVHPNDPAKVVLDMYG